MSSIPHDLSKIKAFIFDVDGVLSRAVIPISAEGDPMRTVNIKDGFAIHHAIKRGYTLGIITGGYTESVRLRFLRLGVQHIYMQAHTKTNEFQDFLDKTNLSPEEIVYCGDDLPDVEVMKRVGLAIAPADAAPEAKAVAHYISPILGGEGIAREVIEQTLRLHGEWLTDDAFGW